MVADILMDLFTVDICRCTLTRVGGLSDNGNVLSIT